MASAGNLIFTMAETVKRGMYTVVNFLSFTHINMTDEFSCEFCFTVEKKKCTIVSIHA